jgi:hypothetical protein
MYRSNPRETTSVGGACSACEYCYQNAGVTNSAYIFANPEDDTGIWICGDCEMELIEHSYSCPCGCQNSEDCCVYYR